VSGTDLPVYKLDRMIAAPVGLKPQSKQQPLIAVAGIADPAAFVGDLRQRGWNVVETIAFADHHRYTSSDVGRLTDVARAASGVVVTTEKDYVRLLPFRPWRVPIHYVPLTVQPSPFERFRAWLEAELQAVRGAPRG
jgi:tetraacyldisaccharide-1-P 4'-kinase